MELLLIYLLSISGGLRIASSIIAMVAGAGIAIAIIIAADSESDDDQHTTQAATKLMNRLTMPFVFALFFAVLTPTTKGLIQAYALVEGSKIVNAKNGKAAAEAVTKRFDLLIEAMVGKIEKESE